MNTKQIGQITEMKFLFECSKKGITVSQPLGDNAPYDFIIDVDGGLIKIQCKTLTKISEGRYRFPTCSRVGHRKNQHRKGYSGLVDYFYAYNFEDDIFVIIPEGECRGTDKTFRVNPTRNGQVKDINFVSDYQQWFE